MLKNALDHATKWMGTRMSLWIPYLPYARQDRVTSPGFAFSLQVVAKLINDMGFYKVGVLDVHSSIAEALIDCLVSTPLSHIIPAFAPKSVRDYLRQDDLVYIIPDRGARNRVEQFLQDMKLEKVPGETLVQADKNRNPATGKIESVALDCGDLAGRPCCFFDDICDGGRTFTSEAAILKEEKNAGKIGLCTTHSMYSKGFNVFDGLIDFFITTNSWWDAPSTENMKVIDVLSKEAINAHLFG